MNTTIEYCFSSAKRLAAAGDTAVQLEDADDMEVTTGILPRDKFMAKVRAALEGPKVFADVRADNGEAAVTMDQLTPLNYVTCSTHFTLKAAMEAMLEHGMKNQCSRGCYDNI